MFEPVNDPLVTSLDTLPLSYRRLVGAETGKLQQIFVRNVLYIKLIGVEYQYVQEKIMAQREKCPV